MKILLIFTLCLISDGGASKKVTGYSGGGVLIKCKYDTEYTENPKYFCKGSSPGCSDQIKTGDKNKWVNSGRFSLFDDTKSAEFRVMIRELTVQDNGTYQCAVERRAATDIYTPVELKVKEGDLVSREVRAYAGGGINIKCRCEDEDKDKPKSFCKNRADQQCFNQITTKLNSEWSNDGRFSIHDNRSSGFFSVFIRELITEDTGTYSCAVVVSDEIETYTVVKLNVTEDLSYEKSISKTFHVGGDLNISCKYPGSLRSDPKFLCKTRLQKAACSYKESVKESRKNINIGKFSLYDDRAKDIFTVIIRNAVGWDSGEYWCGAEAAWTSDHGYKVYFTQINLKATDPRVPVSTSKPTQPSSSPASPSSPPPSSPSSPPSPRPASLQSPTSPPSSSSPLPSSPLSPSTPPSPSSPSSPPSPRPSSLQSPTSSPLPSSPLSSSSPPSPSPSSPSLPSPSSPSLPSSPSSPSTSLLVTNKYKSGPTPAFLPPDHRVPVSTSKPTQPSSLPSPSSPPSPLPSSPSLPSPSSPSSRSSSSSQSPTLPPSSSSSSPPPSPSPSLPSSSSPSSPSSSPSPSTPLLITNKYKSGPTSAFLPPGFLVSTVIPVSGILLLFLIGISFVFVIVQRRHKMRGRAATGRSSVEISGNEHEVPLTVCESEEIEDTRRLSHTRL
ncbi:polymeric immunoglobulin receptor-like isoform X2 [Neoarius graeffei]|uniref:polymeric immunoglobulin receptor-like isoform X2 n=1 Tax=Neoarius graeffei TaxID=443677 RepID=UPI00298BCF4C|nr:polymeric immunoglobulin receptor-like isoform X2 [Neoarius graeffei]